MHLNFDYVVVNYILNSLFQYCLIDVVYYYLFSLKSIELVLLNFDKEVEYYIYNN